MAHYGTRNNWRPRSGGGRFVQRTPENTLGTTIHVCPREGCGALNPVNAHAPPPATCHRCGEDWPAPTPRETPAWEQSGGCPACFRRGAKCPTCSKSDAQEVDRRAHA